MSEILFLSREQVAGLLPNIPAQLDLAERTYAAAASGGVELPPKPGIHPRVNSFIHAMPAYLRDEDVAVLKWVSGYPANKAKGQPYISGLIVLNDPETGVPIAVMDAAEVTAARTAAASGVCIRAFAPADFRQAAILGCGEQGRYHSRVLCALNPEVHIQAYDPHPDRIGALEGNVTSAPDPRAAVEGAQVVVTAGPIVEDPSSPLAPDWLGQEWLALPIDFDFYFQPATIEAAELFLVDDVAQFDYYRNQGHFLRWPVPAGSVGEFIGKKDHPRRVVCANLGIGALDAAFAARVYESARREKVGTRLNL